MCPDFTDLCTRVGNCSYYTVLFIALLASFPHAKMKGRSFKNQNKHEERDLDHFAKSTLATVKACSKKAYRVNEKCGALLYLLLGPKASDTHLGKGLLFICLIQNLLNVRTK